MSLQLNSHPAVCRGYTPIKGRDPTGDEMSFLLRWCLQSRVSDPMLDHELLELGVAWLEANGHRKDSDFVFNGVLRQPRATKDQWSRAANIGLAWIRRLRSSAPGRDYAIIFSPTRGESLSQEDLGFVIREALIWLSKNSTDPNSYRVRRSIKNVKHFLSPNSPLQQELEHLDHL